MEDAIDRIDRVGALSWYGYSRYVQEVKRDSLKTNEKAEVYVHSAIEMPDGRGQKINYLV